MHTTFIIIILFITDLGIYETPPRHASAPWLAKMLGQPLLRTQKHLAVSIAFEGSKQTFIAAHIMHQASNFVSRVSYIKNGAMSHGIHVFR